MERTTNEDFNLDANPKHLINQISESLTAIKSKDTDKVGVPQKSGDQVTVERRNVDTDKIEVLKKISVWEKVSEHKVRLVITICILSLFMSWVIAGLIIFIITGNFSLLVYGSPILIPLQRVLAYYFHRPKEK